MSYIVGLKINDTTSILCDTKVTYHNKIEEKETLKSGRLFPGCIYGGAGDTQAMKQFIKECKLSLRTKTERTYLIYWKMFQNCINNYINETTEKFELILASRHTGESKLYYFNSEKRFIQECDGFVSIGSGKELLDREFENYFNSTKDLFVKQLNDNNWEMHFYSNYYCLWMMERLHGIESSKLLDIGVGGYFHYSYQNSKLEARQEPSLYILVNKLGDNDIYNYICHITFEEVALVISLISENKRILVLDDAAWIKCENFTAEELDNYENRIFEQVDRQHYYNFCGFGTLNDEERGKILTHMTKELDKYVVSRDGVIDKKYVDMINSMYKDDK